jgi:membrane-associated phospholipid phosphatase
VVELLGSHCIAVLTPAISSYVHYDLDPTQHVNVTLGHGAVLEKHIVALRTGRIVDFNTPLFGLTSFPSLHAAMAIVFIWGMSTVAYLRWIAGGLNAGMLAATPLHGSHYFVDVIAGMVMAVMIIPASIWCMERWLATAREGRMRQQASALEDPALTSTTVRSDMPQSAGVL